FLTDAIPEIAAWSAEHGRKLPLLRDVDSSYYLRQDTQGLNLGPYERNCRAHWTTAADPMPDDFSFQLYPDDLDRLEWYIEDAMARVPLLGSQGVSRVINGPIPYAPDGHPMIGPMPGVDDAFEAHSFTFGIAQGGGAGKVMAEWLVNGGTHDDMWPVDPRRFTNYADDDYALAKAQEVYGHEYAMHFPHQEWPAGRGKRVSSLDATLRAAGGQMGVYGGWERANWFAAPGDDTAYAPTQTWDRAGPWEPRVRAECAAVRDHAGVLALPGFSRFAVGGPGAAAALDTLIAGALPKVGRLTLGYFPDERGRILTEMSILRDAEDAFLLITAAPARWHDFELLRRGLGPDIELRDVTEETEALILTGPAARDLLAPLTDGDLSRGWLTHQGATVAGHTARLVRVSFAGELGWEVHAAPHAMPDIYAGLTGADAQPFGMYALDTLRLEKGYRSWKGDLSSAYTLLEAGLDRFLRLDKLADFPGKAALRAEAAAGPARRCVTLRIETGPRDAPYMAGVWDGAQAVGEVTSAGYGYRVDAALALAMVATDHAQPGTRLTVDIFGDRCAAEVLPDGPAWDPANARIRA
ncbi:MAG: glycine cleavage T C-terminal barrel domain-containing protein, partial [Pseudomonadota bacterium]